MKASIVIKVLSCKMGPENLTPTRSILKNPRSEVDDDEGAKELGSVGITHNRSVTFKATFEVKEFGATPPRSSASLVSETPSDNGEDYGRDSSSREADFDDSTDQIEVINDSSSEVELAGATSNESKLEEPSQSVPTTTDNPELDHVKYMSRKYIEMDGLQERFHFLLTFEADLRNLSEDTWSQFEADCRNVFGEDYTEAVNIKRKIQKKYLDFLAYACEDERACECVNEFSW